ncbi:FMN-binding protein [Paenibacillus woosongensis]|uniref:FMN-binding protein n=1 Tax=Paenibacillus woosongensis TaxID=307580 RepID=A0AA95I686_9BACL|nr:FMN-binding protein [Paenibacillus woosongensis]WHX49786.1 FMN-binding protein [Paenibacillus woosongensis]
MKKASILLCSALLLGLLAGCGAKNEANTAEPANNAPAAENSSTNTAAEAPAAEGKYQDGLYFALDKEDPKTGWQYFVKLQVEGGKITDVEWNGTNATVPVDKVTYSEQGKYGMKEKGNAQAEWHEQAAKAIAFLIEKQDTKAVTLDDEGRTDAISGVSIHVNELFDLADKALAAGPIQPGPYKDGNYHAEADKFAEKSGWKETVDVIVSAGNIVRVNFSGVNEAGEDKRQNSIDGKYGMVANGGAQAEWHEQAAKAEQYLVEKQDPAAVSFNDEGKTDAISGVSISLKSYYDLAAKALEQAK